MKLQTTHTDTQTNTLAATANIAYANKQNLRAFPPMDAHKRNNQGSFSIILFDLHYRPISNLAVGFILRVSLYCKFVWQWKITYIQTQIMGNPAMYRKIYILYKGIHLCIQYYRQNPRYMVWRLAPIWDRKPAYSPNPRDPR